MKIENLDYLEDLKNKVIRYIKPRQRFNIKYVVYDGKIICYVEPTNCVYLASLSWLPRQQFKGVATYKKGDGYSIEQGKLIARKKAIRQYWKNLLRWAKIVNDMCERMTAISEQFIAYCSDSIKHLTQEIKDKSYDDSSFYISSEDSDLPF